MKQLARGTLFAAASMSPQATLAAEHMLQNGGNAFDAIVAGQAVLGLMQPNMNGMGSDAVLLIYDAKAQKVWSLNAEGTAPKLATIEWYKTHQNGKIPVNDTLLSATVPGVMDAWYIMLSKWGTKRLADVLAPAIDMAERGVPIGGRGMNSAAMQKYPTSMKLFGPPDGGRWSDGELWKNPDLARTWRRLQYAALGFDPGKIHRCCERVDVQQIDTIDPQRLQTPLHAPLRFGAVAAGDFRGDEKPIAPALDGLADAPFREVVLAIVVGSVDIGDAQVKRFLDRGHRLVFIRIAQEATAASECQNGNARAGFAEHAGGKFRGIRGERSRRRAENRRGSNKFTP